MGALDAEQRCRLDGLRAAGRYASGTTFEETVLARLDNLSRDIRVGLARIDNAIADLRAAQR